MKKLLILLAVVVSGFSPLVARASLIGTSVNGTFEVGGSVNLFDPTNGLVPATGYGNSSGLPVTIGSGIEFAVSDGNILYTFDFSGTGLTVTNTIASSSAEDAFIATFTDTGFSGLSLATVSNPMTGLTASLNGDVLTVDWAGLSTAKSGDIGTGVFSLLSSAPPPPGSVPEPGTLALIGTGVAGLTGTIRRRLS